MDEPLISIIVPVFNAEKYLSVCIESLFNQTYKNIEIICVNDGSDDNSEAILWKYIENDKRLKIITIKNQGASIARNTGLDNANGDYIMFVDSDDWIECDTCSKALKAAQKNDCDVVMWDYLREYANKSVPKNIFNSDVFFYEHDVKEKLHRRMVGIIEDELKHPENSDALATIWGKLYKRSCIFDYNIKFFDIRKIGTYEDGLFNLYVFENVKTAAYIHEFLYHYRKTNDSSITSVYNNKLKIQHELIHEIMRVYIKEKKLDKTYVDALNNRISLELLGQGLNILRLNDKRIYEIKKIISSDYYKKAYHELKLKYFPMHWKVFYWFAKHNFATGVYVLLLCINRLRR